MVLKKGVFSHIEEGVHSKGIIATSLYKLDGRIFEYDMVPISDTEYGLPQTIALARNNVKIKTILARLWIQVGTGSDLKIAEDILKKDPDILIKN